MHHAGTKISIAKSLGIIALVTLVIFLLALVTRPIAWMAPQIYGLHAALCAPLYACLAVVVLRRTGRVLELTVALLIIAGMLGSMRALQMGLPFVLLAAITAVVGCVTTVHTRTRTLGVAGGISLPFYPITLGVGVVMHTFAATEDVAPFLVAATAASVVITGLVLMALDRWYLTCDDRAA